MTQTLEKELEKEYQDLVRSQTIDDALVEFNLVRDECIESGIDGTYFDLAAKEVLVDRLYERRDDLRRARVAVRNEDGLGKILHEGLIIGGFLSGVGFATGHLLNWLEIWENAQYSLPRGMAIAAATLFTLRLFVKRDIEKRLEKADESYDPRMDTILEAHRQDHVHKTHQDGYKAALKEYALQGLDVDYDAIVTRAIELREEEYTAKVKELHSREVQADNKIANCHALPTLLGTTLQDQGYKFNEFVEEYKAIHSNNPTKDGCSTDKYALRVDVTLKSLESKREAEYDVRLDEIREEIA